MFGFVHIQVVGLVVGLADVGQSGGVLLHVPIRETFDYKRQSCGQH